MYTGILDFLAVFLKNRNIISKIKTSTVTDYAALKISNFNREHIYYTYWERAHLQQKADA